MNFLNHVQGIVKGSFTCVIHAVCCLKEGTSSLYQALGVICHFVKLVSLLQTPLEYVVNIVNRHSRCVKPTNHRHRKSTIVGSRRQFQPSFSHQNVQRQRSGPRGFHTKMSHSTKRTVSKQLRSSAHGKNDFNISFVTTNKGRILRGKTTQISKCK